MARLLTALAALTAAAAFAPPAAQRAATRLRAEPDARNLDAPRASTAAPPPRPRGGGGGGGGARAVADQVVSASAIQKTKGGVKYVIVKEGKCPNADPTGLAGRSFCIIDYTGFLPSGEVFDSTEKKGGKPSPSPRRQAGHRRHRAGRIADEAGREVRLWCPRSSPTAKGVCTEGECLIKPNMNLKYFIRLNRVGAGSG
ncbi:hypothetical protein JL722_15072 [Aureococcus anophagefferens]|nr:hypothetical protein JL722_15072 [Aureococcus anophagefferens]